MCKETVVKFWNVAKLFIIIYLGLKFQPSHCSEQESKLINHLLQENQYQKYSRPVATPCLQLSLNITLWLMQIIDLDERNQLLKTNLWLEYYWFDNKLKWTPVSMKSTCNTDF